MRILKGDFEVDDLPADLRGVLIAVEKGVVPPDPAGVAEDGGANIWFSEELLHLGGGTSGDELADLVVGLV